MPSIKISEDITLKTSELSDDEIYLYLPKIMKFVFEKYEKDIQVKEEKTKVINKNKDWDGIIK